MTVSARPGIERAETGLSGAGPRPAPFIVSSRSQHGLLPVGAGEPSGDRRSARRRADRTPGRTDRGNTAMGRVPAMTNHDSSRPRPAAVGVGRTWPAWAQVLMSLALLAHMGAILAAALGAYPSSELERRSASLFKGYYELTNQGYGYRYYSRLDATLDPQRPQPWGTPVVTAELEFDRPGGETTREEVRLPGRRRPWPRLRHQRQLDLAY